MKTVDELKTMSDAEFAERLRYAEVPAFMGLRELLNSDIAAARAVRAEQHFLKSRPDLKLPLGREFANKVRRAIVEQKLAWNDEGLQKAVDLVLPEFGTQSA